MAALCLVRWLLLLLTKVVFDAFSVYNFTVQFMTTISKTEALEGIAWDHPFMISLIGMVRYLIWRVTFRKILIFNSYDVGYDLCEIHFSNHNDDGKMLVKCMLQKFHNPHYTFLLFQKYRQEKMIAILKTELWCV